MVADDDCHTALGYFYAQNRIFFMGFVRNLVRGVAQSVTAAAALGID